MKKFSSLVLLLAACTGAFCQEHIDTEKEKEAIIAVINAETQAYFDKDFDAYAGVWKHDASLIDIRAFKNNFGVTFGWDLQGSGMKATFENDPEPAKNVEVKKNFRIKVYDDCAWAVFDQDTYNAEGEIVGSALGTNFLEKEDGQWKIIYLTRLNISSYYDDFKEIELSEEEIIKYTGTYEFGPGNISSLYNMGNHLYVQATPEYKFELFPMGGNRFYVKDFYAVIEFNMENDRVVSMTTMQNQEYVAKKIE